MRSYWKLLILCIYICSFISGCAGTGTADTAAEKKSRESGHFDGKLYFNPGMEFPPQDSPGQPERKRRSWLWSMMFGKEWPEWPEFIDSPPGPKPADEVKDGKTIITLVNHSTFLIQTEGMNILTDPIWSKRCSPVSWAGPKRHSPPGLNFDDLPEIHAVFISHNHYDHLDIPTLKRIVNKFNPVAVTTPSNGKKLSGLGFKTVYELDWWESADLSSGLVITVVPAQHFSMRSLWDRNETLWGGAVISGPSGNIYFAGDTGYGPHFREIAERFSPIRAAMLPISPYRPEEKEKESASSPRRSVHMGPGEAIQAHLDLGAKLSLACHFQTFQLGWDGFEDAPRELAEGLKSHGLPPDEFIAPYFGRAIEIPCQ